MGSQIELPMPECPRGYPHNQVVDILGTDFGDFVRWMRGQTVGVCERKRYDHVKREYKPSSCADNPHGIIYFAEDLGSFLLKLPIID